MTDEKIPVPRKLVEAFDKTSPYRSDDSISLAALAIAHAAVDEMDRLDGKDKE